MKSKTLRNLLIGCAIALYTIAVIDVTIGNWFGAVPNLLQACVAVAVVYLLYKLSKGAKAELYIVKRDEDEDEGDEIPEDQLTDDEKRIKRMAEEYDQLAGRYERLINFLASDKFKTLSEKSRVLLEQQHKAMGEYMEALHKRIQWECDTANKQD